MHIRRRSSLGLDLPLGGGVFLLLLLVAACGVGPTGGSTSESPGPGTSSGSTGGTSGSSGTPGGSYGASTRRFTVAVTSSGTTAVIRLRLAGEATP